MDEAIGQSKVASEGAEAIFAPSTILQISDVDKVFSNGTIALSGMSLRIEQGSFLSLLGPSGCGKSTLLRIIAGLAHPTRGRVLWRPEADRQDVRPELGFVFQEPTLMPWANVLDNVFLPLKLKGQSRSAARDEVTGALAAVGLSDFAAAYPRELSGGMKMRVSIARALVTRPQILLMDEPFAALDEITRFKLNDDIHRLWQAQKLTVIFVTHSIFESVFLSNRIVVMAARPGRVASDLDIAVDHARDDQFRTSADYADLCRTASAALHDAMAK